MANEPLITLTLTQARVVQDILRYTTTNNPAVIDASFTIYNHLEEQIASSKDRQCTCR